MSSKIIIDTNAASDTCIDDITHGLTRTGCAMALTALLALSSPARAADATWLASPVDNLFDNGANWSGGVVPGANAGDTAFFGGSSITTIELANFFGTSIFLGGITLNAGSPSYTLNQYLPGNGNDQSLILNGAGITNGDNLTLSFIGDASNPDYSGLTFANSATADSATINLGDLSGVRFTNMSTAGNSTINVGNGGAAVFGDSSTAGNATVTTASGGFTAFYVTATGGTSRQIINSGGTLDISGITLGSTAFGSIEGAGNIVLGSKNAFVGSLGTDTEFSGVISGNGGFSLYKLGSGTQTLSGVNTYTGLTVIHQGTLAVNGSVISNMLVQNGGILAGTGDVGETFITSAGIHAPGNSIGTQTINGNYRNIGALQIEADDAGNSDKLIVNGTVEVTGATLEVQELPGIWGVVGDTFTYTIIENDGTDAVTGTFGSVTNQLVFLDASVDYLGGTGNDIDLTLTRNTVTLVDVALTPNQKAVSGALQNGFDFSSNPLLQSALMGLTADSARNAYDLLSGEVHASSVYAMFAQSRTLTGMAGERLWGVGNGAAAGAGGAQGSAMMGLTNSSMELYGNRANLGGRMNAGVNDDEPATQQPSLIQRFAMWVRGYGERSSIDDDGNAAELNTRSRGVMGGGDVALSANMRVGLMGNWGTTDGSVNARQSSFDMKSGSLAAYAGYSSGAFLFKGLAGYALHSIDTRRTISFTNLVQTANADYSANQAILYGEAAYRIDMGRLGVMPLAALRWSHTNINGFRETGAGALNLSAQGRSESRLESTLGLRLASSLESDGLTWLPQARIGWTHAYGGLSPDIDFTFAGGGDFTIAGTTQARDALTLGAGLNVSNGTGLSAFVDYSTNISGNGNDHAISGGLRSTF